MDQDKDLRNQLVNLLKKSQAHMDLSDAVKDFPMDQINFIFPNGIYSSWQLLEHIRITQNDILEFITNTRHKEKKWPKEYWPDPKKKATTAVWKSTLKMFRSDQQKLIDIVINPQIDLFAPIPHGSGQNLIREALLAADHQSYHIGEFAIMRQTMGTWEE